MTDRRGRHAGALSAVVVLSLSQGGCAIYKDVMPPKPQLHDGLTADEIVVAEAAIQAALENRESKSSETWKSGDGTSHGMVTPLRTYKTEGGYYCRVYFQTVRTERFGRLTNSSTACRNGEGRWITVE